MSPRGRAAWLAVSLLLGGCGNAGSPTTTPAPDRAGRGAATGAAPATTATPVSTAAATATATAAATVAATATATAAAAAAPPAPEPVDPENTARPPADSEELQARARGLFEAIVSGDPAGAEAFWFPKEPFIPLKDVKGPDRYWDQLHAAYLADVRKAHRRRRSWEGAVFQRFTLGSTPKWVKPGDEANKIGYFRSLHGTLHYTIGDKPATLDVHTVISWQGRWYVTHLGKFK